MSEQSKSGSRILQLPHALGTGTRKPKRSRKRAMPEGPTCIHIRAHISRAPPIPAPELAAGADRRRCVDRRNSPKSTARPGRHFCQSSTGRSVQDAGAPQAHAAKRTSPAMTSHSARRGEPVEANRPAMRLLCASNPPRSTPSHASAARPIDRETATGRQ